MRKASSKTKLSSDDFVSFFGEFVATKRREKKFKPTEISRAFSRATLYNIEAGKFIPRLDTAHEVLKAVGSSFTEFDEFLRGRK